MLRASFGVLRPTLRGSLTATRLRNLRYLSQETRSAIQAAVDSSPVVLFMKGIPSAPQCGFSKAVVQILQLHGVPADKLKAYNVLEDEELRNGIKEFSEWPTIPQIYVKGEFIGGCDILLGMHQSGELEQLFEKENIVPALEPSAAPSS